MFRFVLVLSVFAFLPLAHSQEDARKLKVDATRPIRIDYIAPSWNKDPDKAESAAILIRDSLTGRMAKVEMTESEPNSALFVGNYQLNFQSGESKEVTPEVYVAPLSMLKSDSQLSKIEGLIKEGVLLRKPYFLRVEKKRQTLSVFDSREQALEAYQSFLKTGFGRPLIDPAAFDAQRIAEREGENKARADQAAKDAAARQILEDQEKKRQEDLKKQQAAMSEAEKEKRKAESKKLSAEALALYQKEKYKEAEEKFSRATELDPDNTASYFQYGVTLYRNEKYNRAIVVLGLAKGPDVNANERDYYIALSYMKVKEFDKARQGFVELKNRNDKVLSGSSAFFAGVIDFQKENYDDSKANFEYVLDNSTDPKMDQQAEAYIEQIANVKQFEEMKKKKFILAANLGLMYDSNILSVPAASAPTDLAGYRWNYGVSAEYRPVFSEKHEFSGIISYADMYSMDTSFKAKTEFQSTDPLVLDVSLPYKWKGVALGKPAQLGLTPTYETITMSVTGGSRQTIIQSQVLRGDGTFVMSDDWFANYALEARHDQSLLSDVTTVADEDDQTANKISLSTSQTFFQDKKKTKAFIYEGALATNMANGDNQKYNRIDLAASYLMPSFWETIFVSRLGLGDAMYPQHLTGRTDTSYSLALVLQKALSADWSTTLTGTYTKNNSTLDTYAYDKWVIMTGVNWKSAF